MNQSNLVHVSAPAVQMFREEEADAPEAKALNPLARLQFLLYGRYAYAITLGIALGILCGAAAFIVTPAKYEIVGYVRVKPYIPKVLSSTDENGMLPSFDTFVDLQESLLQSQRVMDRASQNPDWVALHRVPSTPGASGISTDDLVVDHSKGTELITVTATDRDLNAAMVAVKSILQAYLEISGETEGEGDAHRLQLLEDLRTSLANQVRGIQDQKMAIANLYGTDDLSEQHSAKVTEVNTLDQELQQINLSLSLAQAGSGQTSTTAPSTPAAVTYTREAVATVDRRVQEDLALEGKMNIELEEMLGRMGEKNEQVEDKRRALAALERQMDGIVKEHQDEHDIVPPLDTRDRSHMSVAELRAQQTNVAELYNKTQKEELEIGRQDLKLRELKDELSSLNKRLDEASNRIDQLNLEGNVGGRISILSYGEQPTTPPKSKRKQLTIAGGLVGFLMGIGIVALWGHLDRRMRSVLHARQLQPTIQLLGILPVLPDDLADPEQKSLAAHCVHQVRNLLDTGPPGICRTLAITSPSAGDGKTSLALALGLSFAAAGSRTLLIDCDMVGGGLTSRLNAVTRRKPEDVLLRAGMVTELQLQEAQRLADSTHRKLSTVLLELRYLTESDIQRVSSLVSRSSIGLLEALAGERLTACTTPILAKNLAILPLGAAAAHHPTQLSPRALGDMLDEARGLFDVVIVDTGPILGSLEASIVVREVDDVVLTVSRNGQAPLVKHSIALLQSLGVRLAGLVFNRASAADVAVTQYGSSVSAASIRSMASVRRRAEPEDASRPMRLGSLVAAVVSSSNGNSSNGADHNANGRH